MRAVATLRFKLATAIWWRSWRSAAFRLVPPPLCAGCTTTHRQFERRKNRFARPAGPSWRVDETYVKIRSKWMYFVPGRWMACGDRRFSLEGSKRDVGAAGRFLRNSHEDENGTTDHHIGRLCGVASERCADEDRRPAASGHQGRSSKYLNNLIEQDHCRGVKLRIGPMLGFKWF